MAWQSLKRNLFNILGSLHMQIDSLNSDLTANLQEREQIKANALC